MAYRWTAKVTNEEVNRIRHDWLNTTTGIFRTHTQKRQVRISTEHYAMTNGGTKGCRREQSI